MKILHFSVLEKEDFHDAETDIQIMVQIRAFDEVLQTPWFRKLPILILK
ncbi:hypothetical protein J4771_09355 [Candidatus Kaistella beijingensis]|nr:hypothetical protein [Candidatus Kaistella beijingensis]UBB89076.1 hypothetical protein J4771_09355 [Candidatus Kaistella beijingensis]